MLVPAGGTWNDVHASTNWSEGHIPTAGEGVWIGAAGTYTVTVQFSNLLGSIGLSRTIVVSDAGGPTTCTTSPSPINTIVTYNQPSTSGCTESNHANCTASSPVTFALQTIQYSLGSCYSFLWKFDDGSPDSTLQSPTHTFIGAQSTYAVTVTITGGPLGPATFHSTLNFGNTPLEPVPEISVSPAAPTVGQAVTITNTNPSTRAAKWAWDFGDQRSSAGPDKSVTHTYTEAGSYFVQLTETDSAGATIGTKIVTVVVAEPTATRHRGAHH